MRELAIEGVSRLRKNVFTTRADRDALRAPDLHQTQGDSNIMAASYCRPV